MKSNLVEKSLIPPIIQLLHYMLAGPVHVGSAQMANAMLAGLCGGSFDGLRILHPGAGFGLDTIAGTGFGGHHVGIELAADQVALNKVWEPGGKLVTWLGGSEPLPWSIYTPEEITIASRLFVSLDQQNAVSDGSAYVFHGDVFGADAPSLIGEKCDGAIGHFFTHEMTKRLEGFGGSLDHLGRLLNPGSHIVTTTPVHFADLGKDNSYWRSWSLLSTEFARFFVERLYELLASRYLDIVQLGMPAADFLLYPARLALKQEEVIRGSNDFEFVSSTVQLFDPPNCTPATAFKGLGLMMAAMLTGGNKPVAELIEDVLEAITQTTEEVGNEEGAGCPIVFNVFRKL